MNWPMLSTLVASTGVILALVAHVVNLKANHRLNSARLVLDLSRQFDGVEMRQARAALATALLAGDTQVVIEDTTMVVEFFEDIGYMTHAGNRSATSI
jgi:hypothetical protein